MKQRIFVLVLALGLISTSGVLYGATEAAYDMAILPALTTFVLESALAAVQEGRVIPPATKQILSGLRVELRRIGVNFNQLVAHCNRQQRVRFADLTAARATLQELEAKILAAIEGKKIEIPVDVGHGDQKPLA